MTIINKIHWLLIPMLGIALIWLTYPVFLTMPQVWPDEAIFADIAQHIIDTGHPATEILGNMLPGMQERALFYPPLFFYVLAIWTKLTFDGILFQRLLSTVFALATLVLFYYLMRRLIGQSTKLLPSITNVIALLATIFAAADFFIVRASHVSRPEIIIIFFSIAATIFVLPATAPTVSKRAQTCWLILAGLFSSAAFLTHFPGILVSISLMLFLIFHFRSRIWSTPAVYAFCLACLTPILLWLAGNASHWSILIGQLKPHFADKLTNISWIREAYLTPYNTPVLLQLLITLHLLATVYLLYTFIKHRQPATTLIACLLLTSWLVSWQGGLFWYAAFPILFIYAGLGLTTANLHQQSRHDAALKLTPKYQIPLILILLLVITNVSYQLTIRRQYHQKNYSYQHYSTQIADQIAPNSSVFLSSIPDPYYALTSSNKNLKLFEFPAAPTTPDKYLEVLDQSDYIVFNGVYEVRIFGALLPAYINQNSDTIHTIDGDTGYQAYVIKLKPRSDRTVPRL